MKTRIMSAITALIMLLHIPAVNGGMTIVSADETNETIVGTESGVNPCASGHDWGDWRGGGVPTCENEGSDSRTCRRNCGVAPETRSIAALGHLRNEAACNECTRCSSSALNRSCTESYPCINHIDHDGKGRIVDRNQPPSIFDFIEILNYLLKMNDSIILKDGVGSRAWYAALITPDAVEPTIMDGLEILLFIVGLQSHIGVNPVVQPPPPPITKPDFWYDDSTNGDRVGFWNKSTITVTAGTAGTVSPDFKLGARVGESLNQWSKALNIKFDISSSSSSNISIFGGRLSALQELHGSWPPNAAGLCEWNVARNPDRSLKVVDTFTVKGSKKEVFSYTMANLYIVQKSADDSWSQNQINLTKTVVTHELGHGLGFFGHVPRLSANSNDVMWWQEQPDFTLKANEKKHLRQVYDYYRS
ncbi:MAG: hypothetical protein FWF94_07340 [Oscillospiraceae bacterium]|nr:hypothetical protein [Oscillospiraceae bacterium]